MLLLYNVVPFNEIVITGSAAMEKRREVATHFLPNTILAGSTQSADELPLLANRFVNGKTLIYVCENKTCKLPVEEVGEGLKLLSRASQ